MFFVMFPPLRSFPPSPFSLISSQLNSTQLCVRTTVVVVVSVYTAQYSAVQQQGIRPILDLSKVIENDNKKKKTKHLVPFFFSFSFFFFFIADPNSIRCCFLYLNTAKYLDK